MSSQYSLANSDRKKLFIGKNETNLLNKDMVRAKITAEQRARSLQTLDQPAGISKQNLRSVSPQKQPLNKLKPPTALPQRPEYNPPDF